jgi:hypothetical protein
MKIIGERYSLHCTDFDSILGNFNSELENKFLMFVDEGSWGGDRKKNGKLKTLITEKSMQINKKGIPKYSVPNLLNIIIASNEDWVIPAGKGSRRYMILELDDKYSGKKTKESKEYFDKLCSTDINGLGNYLYNRDLSNFDATNIPFSKKLQEQQSMTLNGIENYVLSLLNVECEIIYNDKSLGGWYDRRDIYDSYVNYSSKNNIYVESSVKFWIILKKIFPYLKKNENKRKIKGNRSIKLEDLEENCEHWSTYMNGWDWNE